MNFKTRVIQVQASGFVGVIREFVFRLMCSHAMVILNSVAFVAITFLDYPVERRLPNEVVPNPWCLRHQAKSQIMAKSCRDRLVAFSGLLLRN